MNTSLVPYIPPACSLAFQSCPDEAREPGIHAGFTPAWFRRRMELDYGERWHMDPLYRCDSFAAMARTLNGEFPALALGGDPEAKIGSLSQIHTCCPMASLFGQKIVYRSGGWPVNEGHPLGDAEADALVVPDFRSHPVYEDLMRQMDVIEREWGIIEGELNYQGVLNTAFRLRGQQIFFDMIDAPERADHVLDVVCTTMMAFVGDVQARQRRSGAVRDYLVTANCVVNMTSGEQYRRFVMPHDRRLSETFPAFGIHNCAWNVSPYAPSYAEIRAPAYLDFGFESDFVLLKDLFPHTSLCAMYSPVALASKRTDEIRADLLRLHEELGACHIIVADIDAATPNERVVDFFRIAADVRGVPVEDLVPPASPW